MYDSCVITVYFEDPFWVGLYERWEGEGYSACKVTFGAEPRDCQVYELLLSRWRELQFSPALPQKRMERDRLNPRRARREAGRSLSVPPTGTKAQEAIKLLRAEGKEGRRERGREERQAEEERRFLLRREKKKQKHKGR